MTIQAELLFRIHAKALCARGEPADQGEMPVGLDLGREPLTSKGQGTTLTDYDAAWEMLGVDPYRLDPVLLDFSNSRAAMKAKYGGEFFPASFEAAPGQSTATGASRASSELSRASPAAERAASARWPT